MTGWRDAVDAYLAQLTARVGAGLGGDLIAVYLMGSAGAGGYEPGASAPDVWALVRAPVPEGA